MEPHLHARYARLYSGGVVLRAQVRDDGIPADCRRGSVGNDALGAGARLDPALAAMGRRQLLRHDEDQHAHVAARGADGGDAAHLPRAIDLDRHLDGRVIANRRQDRDGNVAESGALNGGDVCDECRARIGREHSALVGDERRWRRCRWHIRRDCSANRYALRKEEYQQDGESITHTLPFDDR